MNKLFHSICSIWLSILLLFGSTPMEFVHTFAHHKDTIDVYKKGKLVIEPQHHHCQFLGLNLMPFANDVQLPRMHAAPVEFFTVYQPFFITYVQRIIVSVSLRGPPAV